MNTIELLPLLKSDLQKRSKSEDEFLIFLLDAAAERISGMNIVLDDSLSVRMLVVHYAAYLYRKRGAPETALPLFVRAEINDIKLSQGADVK